MGSREGEERRCYTSITANVIIDPGIASYEFLSNLRRLCGPISFHAFFLSDI